MAADTPRFAVSHDAPVDAEAVLAGVSSFGLAGLTAVDYLADHLDLAAVGRVRAGGLPPMTPFAGGSPRHPTRLLTAEGVDVAVLVGELWVPPMAAAPLVDALAGWCQDEAVGEVVALSGVPVPHGPDDHRPFYVATDGFRERRLAAVDLEPMGGGFLEGVNGALMDRGLESDLETAVFTTPVHAQAPDADAALRLLDAVERAYALDVDTGPLEAFAEDVREHYAGLAEQIDAARGGERTHDDRMYM